MLLGTYRSKLSFKTAVVMQGNQLASHLDLVTSLFQLADTYMLVAPATALASGALPCLCQWAMQAVQLRESEPLRKVINFLTHWTNPNSGLLAEQDKKVVALTLSTVLLHACSHC